MAARPEKLPVEDRLDIMDLFARYYWALDLGDAGTAADCYAEDAEFDHLWQGERRGREAIVQAFEELFYERPSWWYGRQHALSNILISKEGDGARVKAFFQILQHNVYYRTNFVFRIGTVDVRCVKRDGEWKFASFAINAWREPEDVPWQGERRAWDVSGTVTRDQY
jgi:ketosteroid isomerase-like protein